MSKVACPSEAGHSNTTRNIHMGKLRSDETLSTTDDLEAQHRSQWLFKLKNTLRTHDPKTGYKLDFCILKLPEYVRQPPHEYTPVAWRFGLHNREKLDKHESEGLKISLAKTFGIVGEKWTDFCNIVVDDPKSMLQCYGLQEEATSWSDDVIQSVLALDALFLAVHFDIMISEKHLWTQGQQVSMAKDIVFASRYVKWISKLQLDILKYENQIPFELIQRAYKYLRKSALQSMGTSQDSVSSDEAEATYRCWEKKLMALAMESGISPFKHIDFSSINSEYPFPLMNIKHFLQIAYEAICGMEGLKRECDYSQKEYIHIPSATRLLASGIKIKAEAGQLCTMSYRRNCLYLPTICIWDTTISFIRNMAHYEEDLDKCLFHDYVFIMIDLIKTPLDLEALTKAGVIKNENANRTITNWMVVGQFQMNMPSSTEHNELKVAINNRCKLRRYRLWSEFHVQFCSRPWLVMSTIAIILVTIGTLLQAYAAVIGTNRMKAQFP